MTKPEAAEPLPAAEPGARLRRVFIRDLVLPCLIGVYRHERDGKQRVRINVDLTVARDDAAPADSLQGVVSYETVINGIREIVAAGHVNLVETLAERIAASCLTDGRVRRAIVRVEKLDVFADAGSVGVEIDRFNPNH